MIPCERLENYSHISDRIHPGNCEKKDPNKYILPTLEKLPRLNLLGRKTDDEIAAKVEELHNLRVRNCSGTEVLTAQVRILNLYGVSIPI
jgi:hypothetical protein